MSSDNPISIPLGIIIGLLASCVQSLGLTIQRKSHVLNQSLPEQLQRVEHHRPLWLLGFAVFISSNILGSLVQIASLPVVILAPLGAVSLLWNAFFARFILGDVFSPWMVLGTIFIAGGAVLIAFFGIVPEQTHSLEDLLELFRRPTFIAYFSILGFVLTVSLVITHVTELSLSRRLAKIPSNSSSIALSTTANLTTHITTIPTGLTDDRNHTILADEQTPLLDRKSASLPTFSSVKQIYNPVIASTHRTRLILAISYASFSGIISGMCLLFAKSGVELLLLTLRGKNQFWRWEAWCLILGLGAFALLQLWYFHKALVLADPTIVCPSAFCLYNLSSIVNGLVYFDQFSLIPLLHLLLVSVGIVTLLGGVWVVSIQSGGGGVDLGTWDEEIVDLSSEDLEALLETEEATLTAGTMPLLDQSESIQDRLRPAPMERETASESSVPTISGIDKFEFGRMRTRTSFSTDGRPESLYPSARVPSTHATGQPINLLHARFSSSPSEPLNRLFSNSRVPMPQATNLSHAPGTLSSALGSALQIGLSPVSPGFAILPLERKKSPAYATGSDGIVSGNAGPGRRRYWKMQRRRTISDGEVSMLGRDLTGRQAKRRIMDHQDDDVDVLQDGRVEESETQTGFSVNLRQDQEVATMLDRTGWRRLTNILPRWPLKK